MSQQQQQQQQQRWTMFAVLTLLVSHVSLGSACAAHWQARHLRQHLTPAGSSLAGAPPTAVGVTRTLHSIIEPQPGQQRGGIKEQYDSRESAVPAPFTISSVSLAVSFTGPKVTVTNHMQLQPYNSTSCRPAPSAAADSSGSYVTRQVSKLIGSSSSSSSSSSSGDAAGSVCQQPLDLDARDMQIYGVWLDGMLLGADRYSTEEPNTLSILDVPARPFSLKIISSMQPPVNPDRQVGLFLQQGIFVTSFEPYGMSSITPYLDRPDVQPVWTVRLEGDAQQLPVLLSNGKVVEKGKLPQGRHFVVWKDPRPHSSYQTAIVAGKLSSLSDSYTSCLTGRTVALHVYTPAADISRAGFSLYVVKAAMAWFEAAWGMPYHEDSYTMVGVPGIKGEAGEVSQMAVFSVNFLALSPESRTDKDAEAAIRLIGHELFHMWSGNLVTVKSWYDLVLKEGLTTYFEQAFAADLDTAEASAMNLIKPSPGFKGPACKAAANATAAAASRASEAAAPFGFVPLQQLLPALRGVAACRGGRGSCGNGVVDIDAAPYAWRRIADVAYLRRNQVPEDDGEYAHPLRLTNTSKVGFPYTNTIYRKGAEVVRMYRLMLGPPAFTKGLDTFFTKFNGTAATVNDWHTTLSAAKPGALPPNWISWYDQPGTPWLSVDPSYDSKTKALQLQLEQGNMVTEDEKGYPGVKFAPLAIPVKVGLLAEDGTNLRLKLQGRPPGSAVLAAEDSQTAQLLLTTRNATLTLNGVPANTVVSVLRGFSAPVRAFVDEQTEADLATIAVHDRDTFARYNAVHRLLSSLTLVQLYRAAEAARFKPTAAGARTLADVYEAAGGVQGVPEALIGAYRKVLKQDLPGGTKGYMLYLPTVTDLGMSIEKPEPVLLYQVRKHVCKVLATQLQSELQQVVKQEDARAAGLSAQGFTAPAMNARMAANNALRMLACDWSSQLEQQVLKRLHAPGGMSDRITALQLLVDNASLETADAALQRFRKENGNVRDAMLEWLRVQGSSDRPGNAASIRRLLGTPGLVDLKDGDAVKALLGEDGFISSAANFGAADGSGYKLFVDAVQQVDKVNPSAASGLLWQLSEEYDSMPKSRRKQLRAEARRLRDLGSQLSPDTREAVQAVFS